MWQKVLEEKEEEEEEIMSKLKLKQGISWKQPKYNNNNNKSNKNNYNKKNSISC